MGDCIDLARRYVDLWNEPDSERRRTEVEDLWATDGVECTKARVTRGFADLEARIAASHERNVRDGGNRFVLRGADRNNDVIRLDWQMTRTRDGSVRATFVLHTFLPTLDRKEERRVLPGGLCKHLCREAVVKRCKEMDFGSTSAHAYPEQDVDHQERQASEKWLPNDSLVAQWSAFVLGHRSAGPAG